MEKQQIGLIASIVVNVILALLLIFFIFRLNSSAGAPENASPAAKALLSPDLGCVQVNSGDALLIIDVQNDFMVERPYTATNPRHVPDATNLNGNMLKGGSLGVAQAIDIVSHINPLIDIFEAAKGTIIYSLDWHPSGHCSHDPSNQRQGVDVNTPGICRDDKSIKLLNEGKLNRWPIHCVQNTWGAQFDPHLKISTTEGSFVIKKGFWQFFDSYSAFGGRLSKFNPANDAVIVDADANWEDMTQAVKSLPVVLKQRKITRLFIVGIATDFCVNDSVEDALMTAMYEVPGLAVAAVKEAVGGVFPENSDKLFKQWQGRGAAILSEKNKEGKSLFNTKC